MTRWGKILLITILLTGAFIPVACKSNDTSQQAETIVSRSSVLSGSEEVPLVATGASGSGTLEINTKTGAVSGHLAIVTAPTSTIIASHVQEGARGENGCIVITLENAGGGVWNVPAGTVVRQSDVDAFTSGRLYFNIRTAANPLGEIRGQISAPQ